MSETQIYSDLNKIRMVFDCEFKKAMSIPMVNTNCVLIWLTIVWIQTNSLQCNGQQNIP